MLFDKGIEFTGVCQSFCIAGNFVIFAKCIYAESLCVYLFFCVDRISFVIECPVKSSVFFIPKIINEILFCSLCIIQQIFVFNYPVRC